MTVVTIAVVGITAVLLALSRIHIFVGRRTGDSDD